MGAKKLTEMGYPCIGLPALLITISQASPHNRLLNCANTVIDSIDRLRDTSSSHQRISIVEIAGRHCGDLTLMSAIVYVSEYTITLKLA